ncbi:MAG TPA: response regulator [Gemmatimonadales bacterium]|nr:response regulator [Gemmatimonadales bacterium]
MTSRPRPDLSRHSAAPSPDCPGQAPPSPADILLVEDSLLEIELMLRPLQELGPGNQIAIARDGEEALDFLLGRGGFRNRLGAPLPRLVLLDFKLPRLDGVDVLRGLRSNSRTALIPIVVLTSSTDQRQLTQCYQLGANSCVQKPVKYEEFRTVIQAVARYWLGYNQAPPPAALPVS